MSEGVREFFGGDAYWAGLREAEKNVADACRRAIERTGLENEWFVKRCEWYGRAIDCYRAELTSKEHADHEHAEIIVDLTGKLAVAQKEITRLRTCPNCGHDEFNRCGVCEMSIEATSDPIITHAGGARDRTGEQL